MSSGVFVLVEEAAESITSADVKLRDGVGIVDLDIMVGVRYGAMLAAP